MIDDGVIKYDRTNFTQSGPLDPALWEEIESWRKKLFKLNLIGEYPTEKVGFGNMSKIIRWNDQAEFIITGTQTGKYENLTGEHYTLVNGYDLEAMKLKQVGPLEASSEALTHAAVYEANRDITAVFHIHNTTIWERMIEENYDATPKDVPYGTIEMANCVGQLIAGKSSGLIVMKGHQDGVIAYSKSMDQCGKLILELADKFL
ncbi:class II aldolase/adducin family protein [Halobacteriovorax sp. JY17]|uniref:class II aldolase/adducin family protein n=1 Tax=Halobacteriovorax sp. JY17 TaxID=2014617 RepID=UPI000C624F4A|nr:class II aldolase/adducin family protein [Halobacteriovorax sp. JY17]PIK13925.1 MAG: rRNA adenine methyltransferase [Halobacteriovorax sp. JY17]